MKLRQIKDNTINILAVCRERDTAYFDNIVVKRYISEVVTQINEGRGIGRLRVDFKIITAPEDVDELIKVSEQKKIHIIVCDVVDDLYLHTFAKQFSGLIFCHGAIDDPELLTDINNAYFVEERVAQSDIISFFGREVIVHCNKVLILNDDEETEELERAILESVTGDFDWDGKIRSLNLSDRELSAIYPLFLESGGGPPSEFPDAYHPQRALLDELRKRIKAHVDDVDLIIINSPILSHLLLETPHSALVLDLLGSYEGVGHFTIEVENTDLEMDNFLRKFSKNDAKIMFGLQTINMFINPILLCDEAAQLHVFTTPTEALENLPTAINRFDGIHDAFVRWGYVYSFEKNRNVSNHRCAALFHQFPDGIEEDVPSYFLRQPKLTPDGTYASVVYTFIDLIRIVDIDVSAGIWVADFELELSSPFEAPLEHLRFNNRSEVENHWKVELVDVQFEQDEEDPQYHTKYRIVGAFDFNPETKDFPFDVQKLTIDLSLVRSKIASACVLQPPLQALIDRKFDVNGWKLLDAASGTLSQKNYDRTGAFLEKKVYVAKVNRTQWSFARVDNKPLVRSLIPLVVLIVLSWYSSFNTFEDAFNTIQLNTTVFLAGVALYFSAEKPRGTSFTYVDRLFMAFYVAIGSLMVSEFTVLLDAKIYQISHIIWQVIIPCLLLLLFIDCRKRIKKSRA